jgi:hypothetical protein
MAADVLTTANHYFLDIVAGVALTAVVLPWFRPQLPAAPVAATVPAARAVENARA